MTALALFESWRVLRSPLLWLGAALVGAYVWLNMREVWPVVPLDVEFVYGGTPALAAFGILAGGWLGLRDRRNRTESLIRSTPAAEKGTVVAGRLAALVVASAVVLTLVFMATVVASLIRGGHGAPDIRLVVDGALFTATGACLGFAIGFLTGSRALSLIAAPVLPAVNFFFLGRLNDSGSSSRWLLPHTTLPYRYGPLGYVPDIFWFHIAYVAGLLALVIGTTWMVSSRRGDSSSTIRLPLLASALGVALTLSSGLWLARQPTGVAIFGPQPQQWVSVDGSAAAYRRVGRLAQMQGAYPDDGSASECATVRGFKACVLPEYGPGFAKRIASAIVRVGPLTKLPGFPTEARMAPNSAVDIHGCESDGELLLTQDRPLSKSEFRWRAQDAFSCALYGPNARWTRAKEAVENWFGAESGLGGYLGRGRVGRTARILARLEPAEAVDRLAPVWDDLRAGRVTLTELRQAVTAPSRNDP